MRFSSQTITLLAAIAILACTGCGQSGSSDSNEFAGTWSGTFVGAEVGDDFGTFSINVGDDGSVTVTGLIVKSVAAIDATTDVNDSTEIIMMIGHPFIDGELVQATLDSGVLAGGLSLGTDYYVEDETANSVSLHLTRASALASDPPVDLTDAVGEFTITLEPYILRSGPGGVSDIRNSSDLRPPSRNSVSVINATTDVDNSTEIVTMMSHPFSDGEHVQVTLDSGDLVGGLALLTDYYVEVETMDSVSLHRTRAAALAKDPPIDLTNAVGTFTMAQEPVAIGIFNVGRPASKNPKIWGGVFFTLRVEDGGGAFHFDQGVSGDWFDDTLCGTCNPKRLGTGTFTGLKD